ncbi:MAG: hypothetical protein WC632_01055 [Candidatus Margulisiibacteriota bacterium]
MNYKLYNIPSELLFNIHNNKAKLAFFLFEKYVNGAIIQWDRINTLNSILNKLAKTVNTTKLMVRREFWQKHEMMFLDVHYYFICGDKVDKLFQLFCSYEEDPLLRPLKRQYLRKLKIFKEARDMIEHIDKNVKNNCTDLGNIINDTYTFGGKKFDISKKGLNSLIDLYNAVIELLKSRNNTRISSQS